MLRALSSFPQVSLSSSLCLAPPGGSWAVVTDPMGLVEAAGGKKDQRGKYPQPDFSSPPPPSPKAPEPCPALYMGGKERSGTAKGHVSQCSHCNLRTIHSVLHHPSHVKTISSLREGPFLNHLFTSSTGCTVGTQKIITAWEMNGTDFLEHL